MSCDHFMKLQAGMVFVVYCVLLFGAQPASTIVILSLITRPHPQEGEGTADYILPDVLAGIIFARKQKKIGNWRI